MVLPPRNWEPQPLAVPPAGPTGRSLTPLIALVAGLLLVAAALGGYALWRNRSSGASPETPAGPQVTVAATSHSSDTPQPSAPTSGPAAPTPSDTTSASAMPTWPRTVQDECSPTVAVGKQTGCPFAFNVADQVLALTQDGSTVPSGTVFRVDAYSPTTKKNYTMTCTAGTIIVCTGGNNAEVYIRG